MGLDENSALAAQSQPPIDRHLMAYRDAFCGIAMTLPWPLGYCHGSVVSDGSAGDTMKAYDP